MIWIDLLDIQCAISNIMIIENLTCNYLSCGDDLMVFVVR